MGLRRAFDGLVLLPRQGTGHAPHQRGEPGSLLGGSFGLGYPQSGRGPVGAEGGDVIKVRLRYYRKGRLHLGLGYRTPKEALGEALGVSHTRKGHSVQT